MIEILYSFIIPVIGVILYIFKPKWIVIYWLLLIPVFFPVYNILTLNLDREVFSKLLNRTHDGSRNMFIILVIIEFMKHRFRIPPFGGIYLSLICFVIYIFVHNLILHPGYFEIWPVFSQLFSLILPLFFFFYRKDLLPQTITLRNVLFFILSLQVIGVSLNLSGNYVYPTYYIPYVAVMENGSMYDDSVYEGLTMGTFPSSTIFANFLTTIFLFISLEYFSGKGKVTKWWYLILAQIIGVMIILTGIRNGFVLFVFITMASIFMYVRKHLKFLVFSSVLAVCGFLFLLSYDISYSSGDGNEGLNRQLEGMARFVQSKKSNEDDHSTFNFSTYLLENYFMQSPFIGNGLSYKGEFAYGNSGNVSLQLFYADAKIAYIIVEYGLFGAFLYFLFYNSIFKFLKKRVRKDERKKLSFCFIYYIFLTIVDPGLFDRLNFPLVYLYGFCFLQQKIERRNQDQSFSAVAYSNN